MSKLRIGVIGGGGIAQVHLPQLRRRSDAVELVGLADVDPAVAPVAEEFGIARFNPDYRALLPETDAVVICVPTHLHAPIAIDALNAGKAVFCE
jgi:predicted dehydrogenase